MEFLSQPNENRRLKTESVCPHKRTCLIYYSLRPFLSGISFKNSFTMCLTYDDRRLAFPRWWSVNQKKKKFASQIDIVFRPRQDLFQRKGHAHWHGFCKWSVVSGRIAPVDVYGTTATVWPGILRSLKDVRWRLRLKSPGCTLQVTERNR
jgi:hypothetical protein